MTERIYNDIIKETCIKHVTDSGVLIYMLPMEGYSSASAQFTARFGSQDNGFSINGGEFITVPDGTAHYLEHKLFESQEKDAFAQFAQTGAFCNAGTSFDYTNYYFSCTNRFKENLEILLGFVNDPYFTPENVEKERGIIGQEITMYRDNPNWRVFTNLLENMYSANPIRNDIAGTVESISEITDKTLYDCYNAFYNPSNMFICVTGNFDPNEVIETCERTLRKTKAADIVRAKFNEPESVLNKRVELAMPVSKPLFEIGFKRSAKTGLEKIEDYIHFDILFELMFGTSSEFFERMRENGSINEEFGNGISSGIGHFFPFVRGESDNPDFVLEEMQKEIRAFKAAPFSKEDFNILKRSSYGALVRDANNVGSVADTLSEAALENIPPFSVIDTSANADYDKVLERLYSLDEENVCLSVITNKV